MPQREDEEKRACINKGSISFAQTYKVNNVRIVFANFRDGFNWHVTISCNHDEDLRRVQARLSIRKVGDESANN